MNLKTTILAVAATVIAGCSSGEFPLAPVAGQVTLDGEPLAGAHVGFEPVATRADNRAGPGSYATTDKQGHFRLESLDEQVGAVVGKHQVRIHTFQAEKGPNGEAVVVQKEILPARYHAETELTMQVTSGGTETANFELTSQ